MCDLDLALRIEKPILTLDNLQEVKFEKWKHSNRMCLMIMKHLISEAFRHFILRVKGRENIREYIMEMSNLAEKFKSLNLELGEDLIVHLVLISLPTHFGYGYLYLIHEKSQSLDVFKSFKTEVELQLGKKIKAIKSNCGGEYYGRYDGSGEQCPGPFALFLRVCGIVLQYTMPGKPSMNENIRNVVFEEESVNDIGQVLVSITVQETKPVTGDNVQTIVPHLVPKQDYDEVLPQTPIEQPQQPQEVPLRRSIREK
ncbi:hypothetical protein CR513_47415, partial [Mucuna pruriens]